MSQNPKMNRERWQKIKSLFEQAQELDPEKRTGFLDIACAQDVELRNEIERLLASFERAESFMENAAAVEVASMFEEKNMPAANLTTGNIRNEKLIAGTILASRYRIAGLLGSGGMGEVYKAEDIKLDQTVALKFLPDNLEKDSAALNRFISEVRIARQVTHPNVCRVFDIGEAEGRHFISMEYVDGDDLASLLRRIGRLPSERAVEISRQLCVGLHAIHDAGILHRDFKPANIIIDSKGKARITDFGIAALETEISRDESRVGTPAYMSPEQISGKEISQSSDIYALGLVLYEIFTGKQAFQADSVLDLIRKHQTETPTNPSEFVKGIDPLVEKVIFQCLEKNPANRPPAALHVAMALPGENPLQVALEAGETPSPEMVAAAPKKGVLKPLVAVGLLGGVFAMFLLVMVISKWSELHRQIPLAKSGEVLKEKGRVLAEKYGYSFFDAASGFTSEQSYLEYIRENDQSPSRWQKLSTGQPAVLQFWYRQSPELLVPFSGFAFSNNDPPNDVPGMLKILLDTHGRLIFFEGVPAQKEDLNTTTKNFDWASVFKDAGFNLADFQEIESKWTPPRAFDERHAWTGVYPEQTDISIRIEAVAYRGKLVYFQIVNPWNKAAEETNRSGKSYVSELVLTVIFLGILAISALFAVKNVRAGRSDLRGAFRITIILFFLRMLLWAFAIHHVVSQDEAYLLLTGLEVSLFWSGFAGTMYLAFEPYLRKYTPERVISWNRLLAGDFTDPLVGRDILIGVFAAMTAMILFSLRAFLPSLFGDPPVAPFMISNPWGATLSGIRGFPILFLSQVVSSPVQAFMISFLVLFFTLFLRRRWLGALVSWLVLFAFSFSQDFSQGTSISGMTFAFVFPTLMVLIITRFGVLSMIATFLTYHLIIFYPITTELSAWYAGDFILCAIFLLGLAIYGFYTSLAGQIIFQKSFFEDSKAIK